MLHYPPIKNEVCKHCGAVVTMVRDGDGRPFRGRLNYWYSTDHRCPESDRALAEQEAEHHFLEKLLYPPM